MKKRFRREHFESFDEARWKRKNSEAYPMKYVKDFFGGSNEVAVELSKCATGNHVSPPC